MYGYEPSEENFALLQENLKPNRIENVIATRAAVVAGDQPTIEFFENVGKNKGAHSLYVKRGRKRVLVPAVSIRKVMTRTKATRIKLDAEGVEADLIPAASLASTRLSSSITGRC